VLSDVGRPMMRNHMSKLTRVSQSDAKNLETKGRGPLFLSRQNSSGKMISPRMSKESMTLRSDVTQRSEGSRPRPQPRKRSLDATREGSRLSIFGGSFVSSLSKSRKPPPRYPCVMLSLRYCCWCRNIDYYSGTRRTPDVEAPPDRDRSGLSLSRFYHGSGSRKTSSTRSSPLEDKREKRNSKDSGNTKEKRDPALLRKPVSPVTDASPTFGTGPGSLKAGQSILEQIGTPDHNGWMRKKGDRYNTWKTRYFVLQGPHLYWLKSNSSSVRITPGRLDACGILIASGPTGGKD
jgi:hypothetical protein